MQVRFLYGGEEIAHSSLKGSLILGRSSSCDVQFPSLSHISKQHAQLILDESGRVYIVDLDSTHGVFVNGVKINKGTPTLITPQMEVSLTSQGRVKIVLEGPGSAPKRPSGVARGVNIAELLQSKPEVVIGRSKECDIVLDHPSVSRKHLVVRRTSADGLYAVQDLGSLNGTYKNGNRIHGVTRISSTDMLYAGRYLIRFNEGVEEINPEIAIFARGISKRYGPTKYGLHECSFEIPSNSLTAIMGPSGCGKSTLLKAMNGDSPPSSGEVLIAGMELTQNYNFLKTQIGYVPQDDIVHSELTVEECLWYSAKLRLQSASDTEIKSKITEVMRELHITHIKKNLVGKISGGQRKRVAIASEILTDPRILFLDEPTSPLDPQTIEEFLKILQNLAKKGTAVIMVTHKPEDLSYMDSVIFMAEGGHKVYQGPINNYLNFFKQKDTVGVYAQLAGENAKRWIHAGQSQSSGNQSSQPKVLKDTGEVNFFKQYWWLTNRYMNIKMNDKINSLIMIIQAPFIAILVSIIFDDITPAVIFIVAVSSIWFGANNAAREIVYESAIYKRERMFNLGILPYIFSKLTVLSVFSVLQTLLFSMIMLIKYDGEDPSWTHNVVQNFCAVCGISIVATMMGLFLSAVSNTTEKVMTIVPLTLIPQLMLAGLMTPLINQVSEYVSYLTISRWGNELLSISQEEVVVKVRSMPMPDGQSTPPSEEVVKAGEYLLNNSFHKETYQELFGEELANTVELDLMALGILFLIFFVLTYYFMKTKDSIKIN
jgi:ABC transport system ATP-binding/permease protein